MAKKERKEKNRFWIFDILGGLLAVAVIAIYLINYTVVGDAVDVYKYLKEAGYAKGDYTISLVEDVTEKELDNERVMVVFKETPQLEYFYAVNDGEVVLSRIYDYENKEFIDVEAQVEQVSDKQETDETDEADEPTASGEATTSEDDEQSEM